jgi:hypothetical protein
MTDASQRIFIVCDEGFSSSRRRQRCANAALDGPATSSALRGSRHAGMDEVTVVGRACWNRDVKASKASKSKERATSRATSHGESGYLAVIQGHPQTLRTQAGKDKTAGQRRSDLRLRWWPGAGSNRRPSDFQSDARTN